VYFFIKEKSSDTTNRPISADMMLIHWRFVATHTDVNYCNMIRKFSFLKLIRKLVVALFVNVIGDGIPC